MNELTSFIGELVELSLTIPHIEGIKGESYSMTIKAEDENLHRQFIPVGEKEVESDSPSSGSILDTFIEEIHRAFPETQDLVNYRDVMESLKGKKVKWVLKPVGDYILDVKPIRYYVPKRILNASD